MTTEISGRCSVNRKMNAGYTIACKEWNKLLMALQVEIGNSIALHEMKNLNIANLQVQGGLQRVITHVL